MNLRLSDSRIRATCRELLASGGAVSGRQLREALRMRFGAAGQTARVFQIWREEMAVAVTAATAGVAALGVRAGGAPASAEEARVRIEMEDLQRRLKATESAAAENLARAERAELREQAHQDLWAAEVDRLRQALRLRGVGPGIDPAMDRTIE